MAQRIKNRKKKETQRKERRKEGTLSKLTYCSAKDLVKKMRRILPNLRLFSGTCLLCSFAQLTRLCQLYLSLRLVLLTNVSFLQISDPYHDLNAFLPNLCFLPLSSEAYLPINLFLPSFCVIICFPEYIN